MFFLVLFFQCSGTDHTDKIHKNVSLGPDDIVMQTNETDLPTFQENMDDLYDIVEFKYMPIPFTLLRLQ